MRRLHPHEQAEHEWLFASSPDHGDLTGFDPRGWPASTWILHAMYESSALPACLTHDDDERIDRAAGLVKPSGWPALEEILDHSVASGTPLGWTAAPGDGWRRLRWSELGQRLEHDVFDSKVPPCFRSFPWSSWPLSIQPPPEGSLDHEQFTSLLAALVAHSPDGERTPCTAFWGGFSTGDLDHRALYVGTLAEFADAYDCDVAAGSPSNLWPAERTWMVYTDWDLWATKLSGPVELVAAVRAADALETIDLAF
jgi:hypothetical protein